MRDLKKFGGVVPAFYTCYDDEGKVSIDRMQKLAEYAIETGVRGLYLTGSTGESLYLTEAERRIVMESVAEVARGRITLIAHVGAATTQESMALSEFAGKCGMDAIASIPPIYYTLPEHAVIEYWKAMIDASPLPFILYNIPQFTGFSVSTALFTEMLQNEKVIGIKNTTMPVMQIEQFKRCGGDNCVVFNGPDEQYTAGRLMGADGGIGSTYTVMLPLFVRMDAEIEAGNYVRAAEIQKFITNTIVKMLGCHGHLYAVLKEMAKRRGYNCGGVRAPLHGLGKNDMAIIDGVMQEIDSATERFCS